jgi:hypothetical protein
VNVSVPSTEDFLAALRRIKELELYVLTLADRIRDLEGRPE